jgi:hypothetical protein
MKKTTRSVRIGFVRRGSLSQEPNEFQLSPKVQHNTAEQQSNYQSTHQQVGRNINSSLNVKYDGHAQLSTYHLRKRNLYSISYRTHICCC